MASYAGAGDNAFPEKKNILYHLSISEKTYYRYYNQLIDYNYITPCQRRVNNRYSVCDYVLNQNPDEQIGTIVQDVRHKRLQNGKKEDIVTPPKPMDKSAKNVVFNRPQNGKKEDSILEDSTIEDSTIEDTIITSWSSNNSSTNSGIYQHQQKSQGFPETAAKAEIPFDTIDTKNGKKVITVLTKAELEDKISFAELKDKYPDNIEDLEMIFDVLAEVLTVDNPVTPTLRISCQNTPFINVKTEFLKLGKSHIEYVLRSLDNNDNKHKITKNAKSYLMTSLFNAPRTINYYFDRNFSPKPKAKSDEYDVNALLERSIRNFRRNTL